MKPGNGALNEREREKTSHKVKNTRMISELKKKILMGVLHSAHKASLQIAF